MLWRRGVALEALGVEGVRRERVEEGREGRGDGCAEGFREVEGGDEEGELDEEGVEGGGRCVDGGGVAESAESLSVFF